VIGLLERHGLKERAQTWIAKIRSATAGRLLIVYLFVREVTAAMGLTSLGAIRKWCARCWRRWRKGRRRKLRRLARRGALSSARDVGGDRQRGPVLREDIFVAFGAIIFMHNFMLESGAFRPSRCILPCGDPTAVCAFLIHSARLWRLDRHLQRELDKVNAGRRKAVPHEFSANLAVLAGGRGSAGGGGDVMAR
jgi:uncharacterized membrane protein